ncbi:MAG: nitroreductase [Blautia sp.]|nr:nitroreductase [Blautia sp.]
MNEVIKNMETRVSVRSFRPELIAQEELDQIVAAGLAAPSGMNRQPVKLVVIKDKKTRDRLSAMNAAVMGAKNDPFYGAPELILVLADKSAFTYLYDGSLAMGNMLNAAHSLGVGSCWIHRAKEEFETEEGKALLKEWGIEGDYEGIGHCILGYLNGEAPAVKPANEGRVVVIG